MLDKILDGIFETSEEKKAREAREAAAGQARDQLGFDQAVYEENKGAVNDLERDLFGEDPEVYAQRNADRRAELAAQGGFDVETPSGRSGRFDFGTGGGQPATSAPLPFAQSTDQFGNTVYSNPYTGAPITDAEARSGVPTQPTGTASPAKAAITSADRELAQRQAAAARQNTLPGQLDASYQARKDAVDRLKLAIDGVDRVNPGEFQDDWLADANQDYISPEARSAQSEAMGKTRALTDVKETAEEKFMREVARRSQERDLRAQSEAQASQLRARGAYGSGAELAGFLGSQQELAQRRSLEEMAANANAQKRAMQALDQYGNQAFQLGQQDVAVGGLRDVNDRFNKTNKQNWQQFKTKTEQEENDAELKREATKYDADQSLQDDKRTDINTNMDAKFRLLGAKTGTNLAGAAAMKDSRQGLAANFRDEANRADAKHASNIDWGLL